MQTKLSKSYLYCGTFLMALAIVLLLLILTAESFAGHPGKVYEYTMVAVSVMVFIVVFINTVSKIKKEKSISLNNFILSCLRFVISTVMLGYAFTKLHHGHMYLSYSSLDSKLNDLSEFEMVWAFYGRFSAFQ